MEVLKIGEKVRNVFSILEKSNLLSSPDILDNLTDPNYCAVTLKLSGRGFNYPLLLKMEQGIDTKEQRKYGTGQPRFYSEDTILLRVNEFDYFLCSQLEAAQESSFREWLKKTLFLDFDVLSNLSVDQIQNIDLLPGQHSAIVLSKSVNPELFDTVVTSIGPDGFFGELTSYVVGNRPISLMKPDLTKGHAFRKYEDKTFVFVSVAPAYPRSIKDIEEHFGAAIEQDSSWGNTIWVPLMGTGDGKAKYIDSAKLIIERILKAFESNSFGQKMIFIDLPSSSEQSLVSSILNDVLTSTRIAKLSSIEKMEVAFLNDWDQVDHLNRKVFTREISNRFISMLKEGTLSDPPFLVHMHGEWGSGKSTMLSFMKEQIWEMHKDIIVVDFNAWRNQHLLPKWWGLLGKIKDDIYSQLGPVDRRFLKFKLWFEFFNWSSPLIWTLLVVYGVALTLLDKTDIPFSIKYVSMLFAGGMTILPFFKETQQLNFLKSSKIASEMLERSSHPYETVKGYFEKLIDFSGKRVIVFIDDLDRCEAKTVVGLIDGIQTLFNGRRILYIISSDKHWLQGAYTTSYSNFSEAMSKKGSSLGNLFLEKAFQLTFRVPKIREDMKKKLLSSYLSNIKKAEINTSTPQSKVAKSYGGGTATKTTEETEKIIRKTSQNIEEEKEHILIKFHQFFDANPRQIKRLLNIYEIYRLTIAFESGSPSFTPKQAEGLIRIIFLMVKWPALYDLIEKDPSKYLVNGGLNQAIMELGSIHNEEQVKNLFEKLDADTFNFFLGRD